VFAVGFALSSASLCRGILPIGIVSACMQGLPVIQTIFGSKEETIEILQEISGD